MSTRQGNYAPGTPDEMLLPPDDEGPGDGELLRRFAAGGDESAFAALVRRHGPLVLGVCERVLNDRHEAEDAFQVTFLVLARKAGSLENPNLLGNYLYGVAYRTAAKARVRAARRRARERRAAWAAEAGSAEAGAGQLREVLDDELSRLPAKYREPLVLCYLEGKTNEEAARLLGWPSGSMSGRLARARQLLRERLAPHGVVFNAVFCTRFLAQHELPAVRVPPGLVEATARAAVRFRASPTDVSPSVAALAEEMLAAPERRWRRWPLLLLLTLLGAGILAYWAWANPSPGPPAP